MKRASRPLAAFSAITVLNVVATAAFCVLPTIVAGTRISLHFSPREIGVLSALLMSGNVAGSLLSKLWIHRVGWPTAARVALIGLVAANSLCLVFHERSAFLALQCLSGFFGGSLYSLTVTVLAGGDNPDRDFGIVIAAQVLFQAAGLMVGPLLLQLGGINPVLMLFVALGTASLLITALVPTRGRSAAGTTASHPVLTPPTLAALAGCFFFFLGAGCYWTFIEVIGHEAGFGEAQIARSLVVGVLAGFFGALTASGLGARYPRNALLGLGTFMVVLSVGLLIGRMGIAQFAISSCLFNFSWSFSVAYQYAAVNAADTTGQAIALAPAFHTGGGAAGPAVAALFMSSQGYWTVLWLVAGGVLLSQASFVASSALRRRTLHASGRKS